MTEKIVHKAIAETAKSLAAAAYEELARENEFYAANPTMRGYIGRNWRHFIPFARQAMVGILAKDYSFEIACGQYTPQAVDVMKNEIYEALLIDGNLKRPQPQRIPH